MYKYKKQSFDNYNESIQNHIQIAFVYVCEFTMQELQQHVCEHMDTVSMMLKKTSKIELKENSPQILRDTNILSILLILKKYTIFSAQYFVDLL